MGGGQGLDRFATWRQLPARIALAVFGLVLLASALIPLGAGGPPPRTAAVASSTIPTSAQDSDLNLYAKLAARLRAGENYYDIVVPIQRAAGYPVRPGFAVRLPTLAYVQAWLGPAGSRVLAVALLVAVIFAWWRKLRNEIAPDRLLICLCLIGVGSCLVFNGDYVPLHELWAGLLMALSFGLHEPGRRWLAALLVACVALAIRELALPFVVLMGARALAQRHLREAAAWALAVALFAAGVMLHLAAVAAHTLPSDAPSPSWLALRGLGGALGNVVLSSPLYLFPHWLAGPVVVLALFGWLAWKSATGMFGTLFHAGYLAVFAIIGRSNNFYWGMLITPTLFIGLAFCGGALRSLWRSARQASASSREVTDAG